MLSPNPHNDWCSAPEPIPVYTSLGGCKVVDQPSMLGDGDAEPIVDYKHDHEGSGPAVEECQRLPTKRGLISQVHDKPGELREQPDRPILIQASSKEEEGATTIPQGSRAKWLEAPGLSKESDDI